MHYDDENNEKQKATTNGYPNNSQVPSNLRKILKRESWKSISMN